MNTTIVMILIGYVLVTMLLALIVAKNNKTVRDMFNANGSLGVTLIVPLMLSEAIGGSGTVGSCTEAMAPSAWLPSGPSGASPSASSPTASCSGAFTARSM